MYFGLSQVVREPTRENAVLDLLFLNEPSLLSTLEVCLPFSHSCDHNTIVFSLNCNTDREASDRKIRQWHKADWASARQFVASVPWRVALSTCVSVDDCYSVIVSCLNTVVDHFVPCVTPRRREYPRHIRHLLLRKRRAWRPPNVRDCVVRARYRRLSKQCDYAIRQYNRQIESSVLSSGDISSFYRYVRSRRIDKGTIPPLRRYDGSLATAAADKAQVLNNFFGSVFTNDDLSLPPFASRTDKTLSVIEFPPLRVMHKLKSLKPSVSSGPDSIPNVLLSRLALPLSTPLAYLFEMSFSSETVPSIWRRADIVPVFKKGSSREPSNYRPISLTPTICRAMESMIKDRIAVFLVENRLVNDCQHGFVPRRSTTTQLLESVNVWTSWIRDKLGGHCVYIDFAKAFDSVSHSKLLIKLRGYGIVGSLFEWIKNYLSQREQRVRVDGDCSTWIPVSSGVPQGSVLGPLLFVLYINDLADILPAEVMLKLFADDVKLFAPCLHSSRLQDALNVLRDWADTWQLVISVPKCLSLTIGNCSCPNPQFSIGDTALHSVTECRDLGVIVSGNLDFSAHCHKIAGKASKVLGILFRCFRTTNVQAHVSAYVSFVRPILEHDSPVWNPHKVSDVSVLENVQRLFTRRLFLKCHLPYADADTRLRQLNLEPLSLRRQRADLSLCYRIYHNDISIARDTIVWSNRNRVRILRDHARVNCRSQYFGNRVCEAWNRLPDSTTLLRSRSFKQKLTQYLT